jgi:hypothetical protein
VGFRAPSQHDTCDDFVVSYTSWIRCTVVSATVARVLKLAVTLGDAAIGWYRAGTRPLPVSQVNDHSASSNH